MIINVKVKPDSSKSEIENFGNHRYLVYLTEPAEDNRANIELINLLSKYLGIPHNHIKIKFGLNSREKILEIN